MKDTKSRYIYSYNNGNIFPDSIRYMAYSGALFGVYAGFTMHGSAFIFGAGFLPVLFNRNQVEVNKALGYIGNYTIYLGIFKFGKKYPLAKFKYVTAMPLVESIVEYRPGRLITTSKTKTKAYTSVNLFGEYLRGNFFVAQFEAHDEAVKLAKELAESLNLTYFSYDPHIARQLMRGEISL